MTKQEYNAYLRSKHWRRTRLQKIEEKNGVCEICHKKPKSTSVLHVHHLTYKNIGNENMADLMCLCADCHNELHRQMAKKQAKPQKVDNKTEKMYSLCVKHLKKLSGADRKNVLKKLNKRFAFEGV